MHQHDMTMESYDSEKACSICRQTVSQIRILQLQSQLAAAETALAAERKGREHMEEQLEAASTRIVEINKYREEKCQTCFDNYAKSIGKLTERAEQAESETNKWINRCETASQRLEQAEASCAAMRKRLEETDD